MSYGMQWEIETGAGYTGDKWAVTECGAKILCPTEEDAKIVKAVLDAHALNVNFYPVPDDESGGEFDVCPACAKPWGTT